MSDDGKRQLVLVDVETNGLDHHVHVAVEVAWWNLSTGKRGQFIPVHDVQDVLATASIRALQMNRYIDRLANPGDQDQGGVHAHQLSIQLDGNTLVGVNPSFDAPFLMDMFRLYESRDQLCAPEWHYRLWDINSYAAGVLGLDELPGLEKLCTLLGVDAPPDHTAAGDVTAAGVCFWELQKRAQYSAFR